MSEEEHKTEEKQKEECKEKERKLLGLAPVETQHELVLEARSIKYTAWRRFGTRLAIWRKSSSLL